MTSRATSAVLRWTTLPGLLLLLILVPFFLFADVIEPRSLALIQTGSVVQRQVWVAALLAVDVFLPIPSSIVSTVAGASLGFASGALASMVGMTVGALIGYSSGRMLGPTLLQRLMTPASVARAEALTLRLGPWAVAVARPVPVLAEASVVLAGTHRMPLGSFVLSTVLANCGVSLVYAWAGSHALSAASFPLALGAALALPALATLLVRFVARPLRRAP